MVNYIYELAGMTVMFIYLLLLYTGIYTELQDCGVQTD